MWCAVCVCVCYNHTTWRMKIAILKKHNLLIFTKARKSTECALKKGHCILSRAVYDVLNFSVKISYLNRSKLSVVSNIPWQFVCWHSIRIVECLFDQFQFSRSYLILKRKRCLHFALGLVEVGTIILNIFRFGGGREPGLIVVSWLDITDTCGKQLWIYSKKWNETRISRVVFEQTLNPNMRWNIAAVTK